MYEHTHCGLCVEVRELGVSVAPFYYVGTELRKSSLGKHLYPLSHLAGLLLNFRCRVAANHGGDQREKETVG